MALQKPDGGIRPILCGEVWRRCFASLAVNATAIRNEASKLFTSSYDNSITLGDHLNTCTAHSGAKKAHDWMGDQFADLFRTTHKVQTQQVVKSRGQHCGDVELANAGERGGPGAIGAESPYCPRQSWE
jgi:hypothetical protein